MPIVDATTSYLLSHPLLLTAILWPLITAIVTWVLKPRSPAEWASLYAKRPTLARLLKLVAGLGVDAPWVLDALQELGAAAAKRVAAKRVKDDGRSGPTLPPGALLVLVGALALGGVESCATWQQGAKTALDLVQVSCAIENALMGEQAVARVCGIADALIPDLERILAAERTAAAKRASVGACAPAASGDAGRP